MNNRAFLVPKINFSVRCYILFLINIIIERIGGGDFMKPNPVEPEEMDYRNDLDIQASLQMIWEGAPVSTLDIEKEDVDTP